MTRDGAIKKVTKNRTFGRIQKYSATLRIGMISVCYKFCDEPGIRKVSEGTKEESDHNNSGTSILWILRIEIECF